MNFFMQKCLTPVVENIQRAETWQYAPPSSGQGNSSRSQEFVGLRNPACVCYMNSMTQQLFMIPPFRYNLLATDDNIEENYQNHKGDMIDDNVLHQW
jgi:ubiquitin C-terminal hydrolase